MNILIHVFLALSKDAEENPIQHPVLFQSPRMDPILGVDLEMLYLEEIDVSDSHEFNSRIRTELPQDGLTTANRQKQHSHCEVASPKQISLRTPRIFAPQTLSLTPDGSSLEKLDVLVQRQHTGVFDMKAT